LLGPDSVALYIAGTEKPLNIQLTYEAILGRYSPSSIAQPRVDLAPYGAYSKGVSRLHAAIRRTQDNLLVAIDLDSTNGSWLNGTKLEPRRLYALRPGDRLLLGQIEVEVYFNL
jgi:pSer/pThr/pTyr-binding forkhead associated (FHA) protein